MPSKAVQFDLRMAARNYGQEALDFMVACMRDETLDKDTRLKAAALIHDRGYGKPEQRGDVEINHNFCVVPQTMELREWLENKGQVGPSRWLEAQRTRDDASRARSSPSAQPPIELTATAEAEASTSAQPGNGSDAAPAEHVPVERSKLN
jgi:hypothetical protein